MTRPPQKKGAASAAKGEIGARIRRCRSAKGLTGQQLAAMAGISVGYLSELEHGRYGATGEIMLRVARALEVDVRFLLEGDGPNLPPGLEVRIPAALSTASEQLGLSYTTTLRLLEGQQSLFARRSAVASDSTWTAERWIDFYERVKDLLDEPSK